MQDTRRVQACPLDNSAAAPARAAALLWRQKQFADFLGGQAVQDAWSKFYAAGSDPADPTGEKAQAALAQALVDGFASDAGAEKLKGLDPGSDLAKLQAELLKATGTADCTNAKKLQLTSAPCLCNATAPYLHCHALAAKEAAAKLQSMLGDSDVLIDLGTIGNLTSACYNTSTGATLPTVDPGNMTAMIAFLNRPTSVTQECCFSSSIGQNTTMELCMSPRNWVPQYWAQQVLNLTATYKVPQCG
jgi:hypothetical protein